MKKFSRKEILKLMGLAGIASATGGFSNRVYGKDVENSIQELLDELEIEGTIIKASPRNKGAEIT